MKWKFLTLFLILPFLISAQDIGGKWSGKIKLPTGALTVVINIENTDGGYTATMDSPDQRVFDIPVDEITFENMQLNVKIKSLSANYTGTLNNENKFIGKFQQGGHSFDLDLSKDNAPTVVAERPQTPKAPFTYAVEDVEFENTVDNIKLAGTLTYPSDKENYPIVVMLTGSGAQDRNEEIFGHKPFFVIADHFARNGIAVLRFDDRGFGQSEGDFSASTTADFVTDANAAISYIKGRTDLKVDKIGLLGHSEGAMVAGMSASESSDVDFIVLMAGPALRGDSLMLLQKKGFEEASGISPMAVNYNQTLFRGAYDIIIENKNNEEVPAKIKEYFTEKIGAMTSESDIDDIVKQLTSKWFMELVRLSPCQYYNKVLCPAFILNGEKDLQVPSKENLDQMKVCFSKNDNVEIKEYESLNHLFQQCEKGTLDEYNSISQTISKEVLFDLSNWINNLK